jgi:hypothetical protein
LKHALKREDSNPVSHDLMACQCRHLTLEVLRLEV